MMRANVFARWKAVIAIVLLTVVTRLPSVLHPRAIDDEAIYAVVANEIVEGGKPYVDAVERKPPLLFWTYAGVFEVAGEYNWRALHVVALLWTLATMGGLYVIGRELFDRPTGLTAALLASVFGSFATWKNLAFNGEIMMNLPLVWAWAIGLGRSHSRFRPELLAAGALLGTAFLLKQPGAIAAVPLAIYLLLPSYRRSRGRAKGESVAQAAILTAGFLGALASVATILAYQGILREASYWTVADHTVPHVFWEKGIMQSLSFAAICLPLLIGTALALRGEGDLWADKTAERIALFGLLGASMIGAAAGARFYPHYYIQLLPPLVLLAAPAYAAVWRQKVQPRWWMPGPLIMQTWLALTVVAFFVLHWQGLAARRQPTVAGRYLAKNSAPNDRIFVWGQFPEIYLDAGRRPASRYIATFPLTGYVFGGRVPGLNTHDRIRLGVWDKLAVDFALHPPEYVIDTEAGPEALYPIRNFPRLAGLLERGYQATAWTPEGVIFHKRSGDLAVPK